MCRHKKILRHFIFLFFLLMEGAQLSGAVIKGKIIDKQTREPLAGATIQVAGSDRGTAADPDGNYSLDIREGTYSFVVRFIGYKDLVQESVKVARVTELYFELEPDSETLEEVKVTARKNAENERVLLMERQNAVAAIENIGA